MSGNLSGLIDSERKSHLDHNLRYDYLERELSLSHFQGGVLEKIHLVYVEKESHGMEYKHYLVRYTITNMKDSKKHHHYVFVEFGGGEFSGAIVSAKYRVDHRGMRAEDIKIENWNAILKRTYQMLGMCNYSLLLRNCEYVARYIMQGVWHCSQHSGDGLFNHVFKSVSGTATTLSSTPPNPLFTQQVVLGSNYQNFFPSGFSATEVKCDANCLNVKGHKTILVIGPTGSGKSNIINFLTNSDVCDVKASSASITKMCKFITCRIDSGHEHAIPICFIDTIGFCDSMISAKEVNDIILNNTDLLLRDHIDQVWICLEANRIQKPQKDAITQFISWLDIELDSVFFIMTKTDNLTTTQFNEWLPTVSQDDLINKYMHRQNIEIGKIDGKSMLAEIENIIHIGIPPADSKHPDKTDTWKMTASKLTPLLRLKTSGVRLSENCNDIIKSKLAKFISVFL